MLSTDALVGWLCIGLSLNRDLIFPGLLPGVLPSSAYGTDDEHKRT